jgi:trk system potassium uptake protein TrkH
VKSLHPRHHSLHPPFGLTGLAHRRWLAPSHLPILTFAGLILVGTLLLMLPAASTTLGLSWVDALFTATSATCVTGLVVVDTGTRLSLFGQWIVLLLIQLGGLGIMTFSTVFVLFMGGRLSFVGRTVLQDTFTHSPDTRLASLIKHVLLLTLILETLGAALLFLRFARIYPPGQALYYSLFHAISAFCNAGFSLFPDNFLGFRQDPLLNLTICGLIITGGLGFLVLVEVKQLVWARRTTHTARRLSVHSKLVLFLTLLLLTGGTLGFLIFEWHGGLADLHLPGKLMAAFFQSVTTRTAGFNTLNFGKMASITLFFALSLMFIGAGSGSTAGGIKVNTLGVLFALSRARLRGEEAVNIFHRTLSPTVVARAIAVFAVSFVVVHVATMALVMTEMGLTPYAQNGRLFLELLFEVVSAFGTVGLSTGITSTLSSTGKVILVLVMFTGRLGPLAIALGLFGKERKAKLEYPEGSVMVG